MKLKSLLLASHVLMFGGIATAQTTPFITFGATTKVVFTQVVKNGFTVTKATATVSETALDGSITVRRQTEVIVPDGAGGFTKEVTQETTIATVTAPGVFDVETTTEVLTTPLDTNQTPTAPTTTVETVITDLAVNEADLNLPQSTTFVPLSEDLEEPIVISQP